MATDPVCGMQVKEDEARSKGLTSEYEGKTYYFCAPGCMREFEQNPDQFVSQQEHQQHEHHR